MKPNIATLKEDHATDGLLVIYHGPDFTSKAPKHFASIIACKPGECYLERHCAAVQVASDGADLYFSNGRFRLQPDSRSAFHGPISLPVLTKKLRSMEDIKEELVAPEYVPLRADWERERDYHFIRGGEGAACEMFQLLRFWNQFEDQGLSWEERNSLITGKTSGQNSLKQLQTECARAGLELGKKVHYEKQFDEVEQALRKFELLFWYEIEGMVEVAFRNLGYPDWAKK